MSPTCTGAPVIPEFRPCPLLHNRHLMTLTVGLPRRRGLARGDEIREIEVCADARIRVVLDHAPDPHA